MKARVKNLNYEALGKTDQAIIINGIKNQYDFLVVGKTCTGVTEIAKTLQAKMYNSELVALEDSSDGLKVRTLNKYVILQDFLDIYSKGSNRVFLYIIAEDEDVDILDDSLLNEMFDWVPEDTVIIQAEQQGDYISLIIDQFA